MGGYGVRTSAGRRVDRDRVIKDLPMMKLIVISQHKPQAPEVLPEKTEELFFFFPLRVHVWLLVNRS